MTDATPHLGLPLIAAAQAQKHVTHNEALGLLDALVQLACLDKDLAAPPPSPAEGDRYLVAAQDPGGAWAGLSGQVVRFADGVWTGAAPRPGWFAYVIDEADLYVFDGTDWTSFRRLITAIELTGRLGINTSPDATNRLAVKSDAALLSWDDRTPGSGDMRIAVNKQAAARDAALVFQTGFSARALLGTLGGDDFSLKVSGDGSAYATALTASAATGGIDFASAETALAGAATTDLGAAGTRRVLVTGAATVTSFGGAANRERFLRFSGAATLAHDATRLVLPTRANILTAADDTCLATSDASGNWRVRHYQRADGTALVGGSGVASVAGRTGAVTLAIADVSGAAPLASPALTGTPTAPTAPTGTSTGQLATCAFVAGAVAAGGGSGGAGLSFRRRTRNGAFAVNQRGVSGTVTLAAGAYGHDGWKAGANGCTYTFGAAVSGDVTLTIAAGTLLQVMEGALCVPEGGAYVLSWSGSAAARVYQGSASGAYAASPVAVAGLTAGTSATVEFSAGTLGLVQFEPGTAATAFERRDDDLRRCQRYYQTGRFRSAIGYGANGTYIGVGQPLAVPMRAAPTATFTDEAGTAGGVSTGSGPGTISYGGLSATTTFVVMDAVLSQAYTYWWSCLYVLSAEL